MMKRFRERVFLITSDFLAIQGSLLLIFWFKFHSGLIYQLENVSPSLYLLPSLMIYGYWLVIFFLAGMYQSWYAESRFDELITIIKSILIGTVVFYFGLFFGNVNISRSTFLVYFSSLLILCGIGRVVVRSIQRRLLIQGIGIRNVIVVGTRKKAQKIARDIQAFPALGLRFIGFVQSEDKSSVPNPLGKVEQIADLIHHHRIQDVIFAHSDKSKNNLFHIMNQCLNRGVDFYIVPDMYDIVAGHLKTNQIYGFPLVKLFPSPLSPLEEKLKRLIDVVFSFLILLLSFPITLLVAWLIKLDSPGPVFFKQERVGKDGDLFSVYKFRSMVTDAEKHTGPVWAQKNDHRITRIGRIIRKTRIDEIPQFYNVLKGEMSIVGP
nr:sugar transferase [Candidatus Delongbacteria bacterium]